MERQGCSVGCIVATLGLVLGCLLLPYLISSIYSIVGAVFQVPTSSTWLWGDWLGTVLGASHPLYMFLAEGPICCIGTIALLILILGLVLMIAGTRSEEEYADEDEYDEYDYFEQDGELDIETED